MTEFKQMIQGHDLLSESFCNAVNSFEDYAKQFGTKNKLNFNFGNILQIVQAIG